MQPDRGRGRGEPSRRRGIGGRNIPRREDIDTSGGDPSFVPRNIRYTVAPSARELRSRAQVRPLVFDSPSTAEQTPATAQQSSAYTVEEVSTSPETSAPRSLPEDIPRINLFPEYESDPEEEEEGQVVTQGIVSSPPGDPDSPSEPSGSEGEGEEEGSEAAASDEEYIPIFEEEDMAAEQAQADVPPPPAPPVDFPFSEHPKLSKGQTPQQFIDALVIPDLTETQEQRAARLTRQEAGQTTAEDLVAAKAEADRDKMLAQKAAYQEYFKGFTMDAAKKGGAGDEYTKFDATGKIVAPASYTNIVPTNPLFPYYTSDTGANVLEADDKVIDTMVALAEINGDGGYSNETHALGRVTAKDYLVLPAGVPVPQVPIELVGTGEAMKCFNMVWLLAVYWLNKQACSDSSEDNKVKFGLARMEAVKLGWFSNQKEVRMAPAPANIYTEIAREVNLNKDLILRAMQVAWVVPFVSEIVFRTKGHHYITGQREEYARSYEQILKASLLSDSMTYLPHDLLFHTTFHWISPARVWEVLQAKKDSDVIPEAIRTRITAAPAGSALVTTSVAALNSLQSSGHVEALRTLKIADIDKLIAFDKKIKANPPKYHKVPRAYGLGALNNADAEEFEAMKDEAKKLAPMLQGYCETALRRAPLGKQKVLMKYAEENPMLKQATRKYFQNLQKGVPTSFEEIFAGKKRTFDQGPGASGSGRRG